ncbi:hypothetical protein ACU82A_30140 [Bacillus cereus]
MLNVLSSEAIQKIREKADAVVYDIYGNESSDFWHKAEALLLQSLVIYIELNKLVVDSDMDLIAKIQEVLSNLESEEYKIKETFERYPGHLLNLYTAWENNEQRVKNSIATGLYTRLQNVDSIVIKQQKEEGFVSKHFTTVGLHDANFEMEILVHSFAETKEEAEKIGNSDKFNIGYLYEDKLVMKGETLTIKREQTDKYQFRICREMKPFVNHEDYEDITWDEAIKYLIEEENRTLPFTLESYYYATYETQPFVKNVQK